jgi:hypothetical protein
LFATLRFHDGKAILTERDLVADFHAPLIGPAIPNHIQHGLKYRPAVTR